MGTSVRRDPVDGRTIDLAALEIVFLLGSIVATTVVFFRVSLVAGSLLVPYGVWVAFAAFLNFSLWRLNT